MAQIQQRPEFGNRPALNQGNAKQRHQVRREQTRLPAPIRPLQSKPSDLAS
jgi:hypothetical protein